MTRLQHTIAELIMARPAWGRVFAKLGVDLAADGGRSLGEVCRHRGIEASAILDQLATEDLTEAEIGQDIQDLTLTRLCDHLVAIHHESLKREMGRLGVLLSRAVDVDGPHHEELQTVPDRFAVFERDLVRHLEKEEKVLFPMLKRMEASGATAIGPSVRRPHAMTIFEAEHDRAMNHLGEIRRLLNDYVPPVDASLVYRALLSSLEKLEADLRVLVWKENEILFPKASRFVEARLLTDGQ